MKRTKLAIAIGTAALAGASVLAGCGLNKVTQPFNDAGVTRHINNPAEVGNMPDGFNNFSEKCDGHGNRIIVIFHSDGSYGAVTAVRDPSCPGYRKP